MIIADQDLTKDKHGIHNRKLAILDRARMNVQTLKRIIVLKDSSRHIYSSPIQYVLKTRPKYRH